MVSTYTFRCAIPSDAKAIAQHRSFMLRDMGAIPQEEVEELIRSSAPWLERLLIQQEYVGWLALFAGEIVAGGGIHVREMGPGPGCYRVGRWGHIVNVYTAPAHRRQGLARSVLKLILEWAQIEKLDRITLTASKEGEALYRSLGFTPTPDMQLTARR